MTLAGRSDAEIADRIKVALRTQKITPLEAGAMGYMMSKSPYQSDDGGHDMAHVMFYIPSTDGATWGANAPSSPIFGGSSWFYTPGHQPMPPPCRRSRSSWSESSRGPMARLP
jgi:hypothetical protein